jgi:hypothetical protein
MWASFWSELKAGSSPFSAPSVHCRLMAEIHCQISQISFICLMIDLPEYEECPTKTEPISMDTLQG